MKYVIVGLGISGKAAASFLQSKGHEVVGVERLPLVAENMEVLFEGSPPDLQGVDCLIKSPGVPYRHPWIQAAQKKHIPVLGEIDLAFAELAKRNKKIFGITGANGKTTTALLTAHLLQLGGERAVAAGNVGTPLIALVEREEIETLVVELSSFQLEKIQEQKVLDGGIILNITPNHLDWHPTFEDYVQAKMRLALCLKESAPLYMSRQVASLTQLRGEIFEEFHEKVETILSLGYRDSLYPHDYMNALAAYALVRPTAHVLNEAIATFARPPHRLEIVQSVAGVTYINDSKATNVDAVIKAVQALQGPIFLIAGGVDKGGSFRDWLSHFKEKVHAVFAFGASAERMAKELATQMCVEKVNSLEEGVIRASKKALPGHVVLLSPGCSSYDQFENYEQRGETFRQIVKERL